MNAVKRGVHYWSWVFLESMGIGAIVVVCVLAVRSFWEERHEAFPMYCSLVCGVVLWQNRWCCVQLLTWFLRPASCFNSFNAGGEKSSVAWKAQEFCSVRCTEDWRRA